MVYIISEPSKMLRMCESELTFSFCSLPKEWNEDSLNKYLLSASYVLVVVSILKYVLDFHVVENTSPCPHGAYMLVGRHRKTNR